MSMVEERGQKSIPKQGFMENLQQEQNDVTVFIYTSLKLSVEKVLCS